ncbi:hypothetical protein Q3G72_004144 [Acer saccharum]|nr:hypothetical protein Q3G72_004144 [Acer saccharum]
MSLDFLPEDCFAHILSFTSPSDACRLSLVSSMARSAADSDNVWEKFLPSDYQEILSRLVWKVVYSSKKDLFFRLCYPHLIDGGRKEILSTGPGNPSFNPVQENFQLHGREILPTGPGKWKPLLQSRFAEVVELGTKTWLEIHGKINSNMISVKTVYVVYLIIKFADRAYGLDSLSSVVSLEVGDVKSRGMVYLRSKKIRNKIWNEVKGEHLKGGLIVEGIEIRTKH